MSLDLLVFAPHPDDAEIFCGGIIATSVAQGHRAGVVDLTRGELASRGTPEERAREAEAAAAVLGLALRENLGLPDGFVSDGGDDTHVARVVECIRRLRPELVLAPWRAERHPDHEATSQLVRRAVFMAGLRQYHPELGPEPYRPRQLLFYAMRYRMPVSFVVDTSAVWERKLAAIRCHASQVGARADGPKTLVGAEGALAALEARDRYAGSLIGVAFGEALCSDATLAVPDVVAHFRRTQSAEPFAFEERG